MLLAAPPAGAQTTIDYDSDDDGLIEITTMEQFGLIHPDWNGDGCYPNVNVPGIMQAYPNGAGSDGHCTVYFGCQTGADTPVCRGYELMADLDFDSDGDGDVDANDHNGDYWNGGAGWTPIPVWTNATFDGNGHIIRNLTIINNTSAHVGLFGDVRGGGRIYRLGLENASVTSTRSGSGNSGHQDTGILAGQNQGIIRMSYATGSVTQSGGGSNTWKNTGGLVGYVINGGRVYASWSNAAVTGPTGGTQIRVGGLAGRAGRGSAQGFIHSSYARGSVTARSSLFYAAGLVGFLFNGGIYDSYATGRVTSGPNARGLAETTVPSQPIETSYFDTQTSGRSGTHGRTTAQLKGPTGYTGLYADWDANIDGVDGNDDPWDFGTRRNYPLLQVDFNGDGRATCEEFGPQPCYREPGPPPYNPAHDHPEIYQNARYEMAVACDVRTTWTGDEVTTATLTFDLGEYTRPIALALSLWDGTHFRSLQSQNISMPELRQEGQTATVTIATDPASTRFRIDSEYGLNLVLGYADCHTDDP